MYLVRLLNIYTDRAEAIIVYSPLPVGSVIGWGRDEHRSDKIARWTVQSCEEYTGERITGNRA